LNLTFGTVVVVVVVVAAAAAVVAVAVDSDLFFDFFCFFGVLLLRWHRSRI